MVIPFSVNCKLLEFKPVTLVFGDVSSSAGITFNGVMLRRENSTGTKGFGGGASPDNGSLCRPDDDSLCRESKRWP